MQNCVLRTTASKDVPEGKCQREWAGKPSGPQEELRNSVDVRSASSFQSGTSTFTRMWFGTAR